MGRGRFFLRGCVLAASVVGCRETPTQARLVITTTATCPVRGLAVYTARTLDSFTTIPSALGNACSDGYLGDLYVHPPSDAVTRAYVRVVLGKNRPAIECTNGASGCIESTRVIDFVPGTVTETTIVLDDRCDGVRCNAGDTCNPESAACTPVDPALGDAGASDARDASIDATDGSDASGVRRDAAAPAPPNPTVTIGDGFVCTATATVAKCWGKNDQYQHGDGTTTAPGTSTVFAPMFPSTIAAGGAAACSIIGGALYCWGNPDQAGLGSNMVGMGGRRATNFEPVYLSLGVRHGCAVEFLGGVWCWGDNSESQLGGTVVSATPMQIPNFSQRASVVASGDAHSCMIARDTGAVYCWGRNTSGQAGQIVSNAVGTPQLVALPASAVELRAGGNFTCARLVDNTVRCWGANNWHQLGAHSPLASSSTPLLLDVAYDVQQLALGGEHACAVAQNGVVCWGRSGDGQTGTTAPTVDGFRVPAFDGTLTYGASLGAGRNTSCLRLGEGAGQYGVRCWGSDMNGELGRGSIGASSALPVSVVSVP